MNSIKNWYRISAGQYAGGYILAESSAAALATFEEQGGGMPEEIELTGSEKEVTQLRERLAAAVDRARGKGAGAERQLAERLDSELEDMVGVANK